MPDLIADRICGAPSPIPAGGHEWLCINPAFHEPDDEHLFVSEDRLREPWITARLDRLDAAAEM